MHSFVNANDINLLKKNGIEYDEDIKKCINEMKRFLYKVWPLSKHNSIDNMERNTIEEFNKLIGWPSKRENGLEENEQKKLQIVKNIEDNYVSLNDETLLSETTKIMLEYFYNIYLD